MNNYLKKIVYKPAPVPVVPISGRHGDMLLNLSLSKISYYLIGSIRLPRRWSRRTKITSVALNCTQSSLHPSTFIDEFIPRVVIRNYNEAVSLSAGTIFDCSHFGSDCTIVFILKQKINFLDHAINSWLNDNCIKKEKSTQNQKLNRMVAISCCWIDYCEHDSENAINQ